MNPPPTWEAVPQRKVVFIQLDALSFEEGQDISDTRPNGPTGTGFTISFEDVECFSATNSIT